MSLIPVWYGRYHVETALSLIAMTPLARVSQRPLPVDYYRKAVPTTELGEAMLKQQAPDPAALTVLDTIRAMPETYRETLILRLVEGMTGPEIAIQTGLTPDSVRVNLHRDMKLLREKLEGSTTR